MDTPPERSAWGYGSYLRGFRELLRRLESVEGFELIPVEVQGPGVAIELEHWLEQHSWSVRWTEPSGAEEWPRLADWLCEVPRAQRMLVLVAGRRPQRSAATGARGGIADLEIIQVLRRVNLKRDVIAEQLTCPLLWVGPREFLELTWREAPDFWSLAGSPVVCQPELLEAPESVPSAAHVYLSEQMESAIQRQAWKEAAEWAMRLARAQLEEGSADSAIRSLERAAHDTESLRHRDSEAGLPGDLADLPSDVRAEWLLLHAEANIRLRRSVDAAQDLLKVRRDPDPRIAARALLGLGRLHEQDGKFDAAVGIYRRALDATKQRRATFSEQDPSLEAQVHLALGRALARDPTRFAEALKSLEDAVDMAEDIGDISTEALALATLATVWGRYRDGQRGRGLLERVPALLPRVAPAHRAEVQEALVEATDVLLVGPPPRGEPEPPGRPYNPEWYVRRPEEEKRALNYLKYPGAAISVWGPDDMGKSTFVGHLLEVFRRSEKKEQREVRILEVDMERVGIAARTATSSVEDAFFGSVVEQLLAKHTEAAALVKKLDDASSPTWQKRLELLFSDHLLPDGRGNLVVVFRDVEKARAEAVQGTREMGCLEQLLIFLRSICEEARASDAPLRVILTFAPPPEQLVGRLDHSPITNLSLNIEMQRFGVEQIHALAYLYRLPCSSEDARRQMERMGGHPVLLKSVFHHAASRRRA